MSGNTNNLINGLSGIQNDQTEKHANLIHNLVDQKSAPQKLERSDEI